MALRLFNTLSRTLEPFTPCDPSGRQVGMYCCGPTVYDFGHIGNFRTFAFADLVRRHLTLHGFQVNHVMNITDVEDKIIRRLGETGLGLTDYTRPFIDAFLEDLQTLNCLRPDHLPKATEHVADIIQLIQRLEQRGLAYQAADGSVYFSIQRYRGMDRWPGCPCRYGQLIPLDLESQRPTERVSSDEYSKEDVADFALWKARVPEDGEVFWDSPWGPGRPGWHIECSAMSMKVLGDSFDLHLGGEDLAFPHHEDEIAQSEGAGGLRGHLWERHEPFVRYWLHGAHLLVEGRKMSKSLGNFHTLRDLVRSGYSGREIRFLLLSAHYRETFNFTLAGLDGARSALARLDECLTRLREMGADASARVDASSPDTGGAVSEELLRRFMEAMDEDLNVAAAWGAVFEWVRDLNRLMADGALSGAAARRALEAWGRVDSVLGVGSTSGEVSVPPDIQELAQARLEARKARDWARADTLRDEIRARGWSVEDTPKGLRFKPLSPT